MNTDTAALTTTTSGLAATMMLEDLHGSLGHPLAESMNFLNEVAQRYPDAISFAAGRPTEQFFGIDAVHRYLDRFREHLLAVFDGDEVQVHREIMQYGRTKGIIHDLIARNLMVDENMKVDPESIVVTVGCQEALFLTLRVLRRTSDDVMLAVSPSYVGAVGAAQLVDMPVLPVASSSEGIDFDDLVRQLDMVAATGRRVRALYVVADFANPSGVSLDLDARLRLLRLAAEHDFLLLEDNPYGLFTADGEPGPPTLKALDSERRVVYLGSFSKTALPGARVGYVVADQRVSAADGREELLADQLGRIKSMLTVNTSPLAQAVIGGKLLEHDFSLRAGNVREQRTYRDNLLQMLDGLRDRFPPGRYPEVTWNVPTGGFFLVLTVPFAVDDQVLEHSARAHQVLWTPMHHFYGDGVPVKQIRLSVSHVTPAELDAGLDNLAAFLREYRDH
ncbi:PLP-dependent aminotransferase family protein [Streptomyces sp. NPDC088246]|uniref:aminotransferase-like domain-containing protein n=1 Tax=Streptomyces sp. NPDC088246 TaxID=3365842 RepID=UPI0037F9B814